eukprot:CAMPEP_0181383238 /NCGR_PEP_ID=MMETSP1106-20121128/21238_1 /TAXON_ID=81844 /ORGANISM="Mantoniella antarctica, Strain SL-175" /LENGTH=125 /DNA_ID=CAMNT_0023502855 /DNA_START=39 /DNA_END=416 /DNA_ORIENTATION=-
MTPRTNTPPELVITLRLLLAHSPAPTPPAPSPSTASEEKLSARSSNILEKTSMAARCRLLTRCRLNIPAPPRCRAPDVADPPGSAAASVAPFLSERVASSSRRVAPLSCRPPSNDGVPTDSLSNE